jgi:hypothetical protein
MTTITHRSVQLGAVGATYRVRTAAGLDRRVRSRCGPGWGWIVRGSRSALMALGEVADDWRSLRTASGREVACEVQGAA